MGIADNPVVIGWGESYADDDELKAPLQLAGEAIRNALDRAGIEKDEIEGLLTGWPPLADQRPRYNNVLSSHFNLTPTFSTTVTFHSAGVISMFKYAALAVETGVADPVLCVQSDAAASFDDPQGGMAGTDVDPVFEHPYGLVYPGAMGLIARRQMAEFGTTREQFARVAVSAREWGVDHPHATLGDKGLLTVEEVLDAPPVAEPLGLYDCVPWGPAGTGGAFIVTSAENADSYDGDAVEILGTGECSTHEYVSARPSLRSGAITESNRLTHTGARKSSRLAYEAANLGPDDVDVAEVTYMFSNVALLLLADLGFCDVDEAGEFVANGGIAREGGEIAFNTHGGDLTFGQPGVSMWMNTAIECIRQLTGETLGATVPDVEVGLVHGMGSTCACHSTALLGRGGR
ncbi:thiolase family protein [Natronosalvus halobius]|uniref:thiolase family protein n=1 Tax=Natronosalvus halobius TaxID=2953746 RepID=UPI0020A15064|nr:thiolase family protein [Natronosalvus halobius]USZ73608.1 thiolase family protein [Natronosalvus halobius]